MVVVRSGVVVVADRLGNLLRALEMGSDARGVVFGNQQLEKPFKNSVSCRNNVYPPSP